MIVQHFMTPNNESNAFILACEQSREALLVDAGAFTADIEAYIDSHELVLKAVFITHAHYDHTDGLPEIVEQYAPRLYASAGRVAGCGANRVKHDDTIHLGRLSGTVLATPGHTNDALCLVFPGLVFTGDTLFAGSIGGTRGTSAQMQEIANIRKHILTLPGDYEVHTGHGPSSTVSVEKRFNPFLTP